MVILSQLLQRLCDADVDFVVVGGFAALIHGSTQVTRDLGICAVLSREDVAKLREALRDLNPTHRLTSQRLSFLTNPDAGVPVQKLYLETEIGTVDILSSREDQIGGRPAVMTSQSPSTGDFPGRCRLRPSQTR